MQKDYSLKSVEFSTLPSLYKKSAKKHEKIYEPVPKLIFDESINSSKEHPKKITEIKAQNFLNRTMNISAPSVILNLSDCIKKQQGIKFQNDQQFSQSTLLRKNLVKNYVPQKQNIPSKSMHLSNLTKNSQLYLPDKNHSFQRVELLSLAKWIDEKLEQFNCKGSITINQIIDYKQHILNYGLSTIIQSVSKKCKQQGDLLKILWQNSFQIFQKVLQVVSNSIQSKQKDHEREQKQSKKIYDMNLSFLKNQNHQLSSQLNDIYEKMKKVIIWNKRLRKQKKNLTVINRIQQYRNQTYSQALEQTIDMFLKAVPQPATLNFSKKIIAKLAREKRRKRKGLERNEVQHDFNLEAKQLVLNWLRRNGFKEFQQEQIDPLMHLTNDQKLQITRLDDDNKNNQVDIYEYFKLLDIGIQATEQFEDISCQYDLDIKPKTHTRGVLTDTIFKKNFQIQTSMNDGVWFKDDAVTKIHSGDDKGSKIIRKNQKKKSNVSRFSQKSEILKDKAQNRKLTADSKGKEQQQKNIKINKNGLRGKIKGSGKPFSKQQNHNPSIQNLNQLTTQSLEQDKDHRFCEKDFTIISEKKSEQFNFDSDQEVKASPSEKYRVSISKLNGIESKIYRSPISKNKNADHLQGRQVSIKDFTEMGFPDDGQIGQNNLKKLWQAIQIRKMSDSQKRDSRLSMNFIKHDTQNYSFKQLEKKSFNQIYQESKINSDSKQKQRQQLFQTIVRKRSFYKKGKITFQNALDVDQSKQTKANLYKSYIHYKTHRNRTVIEMAEEQEQRVEQIHKNMAIPSNLAKSKALAASKQMFKQLSDTCKKTKKQPPKNKQYFNSSLVSITKNVGALVHDYLRQIKRQKQDIQNDCQKTYYPLHTILMEKMNYKYGLKDISEKKIRDFIQKILTFAPLSEKISLYSLLFGMEVEGVGADELLIYLKCLIYLQKKQPLSSSIHILKQTNLSQKANTDHQIVQQNIEKILKQFFDKEGLQIAKNQINLYLQLNSKHLSIEKISEIIIRCLLKRKQVFRKDCTSIYKLSLSGSNIFTNLYKILNIYNKYRQVQDSISDAFKTKNNRPQNKPNEVKISSTLKQFIKRSDVIDEIYGKSISFDRFLTAYMVTQFPKYDELQRTFRSITQKFGQKYHELNSLKQLSIKPPKQSITEFCSQNLKFLEQIQRKWHIKNVDKTEEETWEWNVTKTVTQHIQTNMKGLLGKLGIITNQIDNFFFSLQNKNQGDIVKAKQLS